MPAYNYLYTLNDLFYALFVSENQNPVVQGIGKCNREEYFELFFPKALYEKYINKSKSNLTWFFNNDYKNKAIKRTLMEMLEEDSASVLNEMHRKCQEVLWPSAGHASFRNDALQMVLSNVKINGSINAEYKIIEKDSSGKIMPCKLTSYFEADASSALARMILTLAISPDASEELIGSLWDPKLVRKEKTMKTDEELFYYYRLLDREGKKEEAYKGYEELIKQLQKKQISETWESMLYTRMGMMLMHGEGHHADTETALQYLEKGLSDAYPESYYLYSRYAKKDKALKALQKAADVSFDQALREIGNAYYMSNTRLGIKKDMDRAMDYFQKGSVIESADGAYCAYMLGRILEDKNQVSEAKEAYQWARKNGSQEAYERLLQLQWEDYDQARMYSDDEEDFCYYFINDHSGANHVFYRSLKDHEKVTIADTETHFSQWLNQTYQKEQDLCVVLLSEDEKKNREDCVFVFRQIYQYAKKEKEMIKHIKVYVSGNHDVLSLMTDRLFASMKPFVFPVLICDMHEDAVTSLLTKAPLFLPCIQEYGQKNIQMNIIGNGKIVLPLLKHVIRLPMPRDVTLEVNVFADHTDEIETALYDGCPGILTSSPMIKRIIPEFYDVPYNDILKGLRRIRLNRQNQKTETGDILTKLITGNYYVICTDDDTENNRFGLSLRTELLKMSADLDRIPFIAVYVKDEISSILSSSMHEETNIPSFNRYDLYPFGSISMYTKDHLDTNIIEKRAYFIHSLYDGNESTYYTRSFNRDSSKAEAESLIYRMFQAGIYPNDWHMYGNEKEESRLSSLYTQWLNEDHHLDEAAHDEHDRWNTVMLTYGWEQATPAQVFSYVKQGNPGHQMNLVKLHPFICEWEALQSGKLLEDIRDIVNSLYPDNKVYNPIDYDRETVKNTESMINCQK